jgi:hypothetical protein
LRRPPDQAEGLPAPRGSRARLHLHRRRRRPIRHRPREHHPRLRLLGRELGRVVGCAILGRELGRVVGHAHSVGNSVGNSVGRTDRRDDERDHRRGGDGNLLGAVFIARPMGVMRCSVATHTSRLFIFKCSGGE